MTPEELQKVEDMVNESISRSLPVVIKNMPIEEARKTGAQALFGEKYGDIVRVVNMGDYSIEFCGGTHVANTSEIGAFKILSESGVAAGVRRIEALTSKGLMDYYGELEQLLHEAAKLLKATPDTVSEKIAHLQAENKELHSEVESLKSKLAKDAMGDVMDQVEEVAGVKVIAVSVEDMDMNGLRDLQGHRTENSILQIRECVYPIYTAQNVHFGWNEKVIGFVQSLKYYDSIVKKEAEKGIAAYSFSASFIYTY